MFVKIYSCLQSHCCGKRKYDFLIHYSRTAGLAMSSWQRHWNVWPAKLYANDRTKKNPWTKSNLSEPNGFWGFNIFNSQQHIHLLNVQILTYLETTISCSFKKYCWIFWERRTSVYFVVKSLRKKSLTLSQKTITQSTVHGTYSICTLLHHGFQIHMFTFEQGIHQEMNSSTNFATHKILRHSWKKVCLFPSSNQLYDEILDLGLKMFRHPSKSAQRISLAPWTCTATHHGLVLQHTCGQISNEPGDLDKPPTLTSGVFDRVATKLCGKLDLQEWDWATKVNGKITGLLQ